MTKVIDGLHVTKPDIQTQRQIIMSILALSSLQKYIKSADRETTRQAYIKLVSLMNTSNEDIWKTISKCITIFAKEFSKESQEYKTKLKQVLL